MQGEAKVYGGVVVRLSDRLMLCKTAASPTTDFSIPGTVWADVVSKCAAPNFRTSSFIPVGAEAEGVTVQLSYHVMADSELAFAIIGGAGLARRQAHAALDEAARTFRKMFVEGVARLNPKTVEVFARPFRDVMLRQGDGNEAEEKVRRVKAAVEEVKDIALDNVERVIQRGQRIDDIVQSTEDLQFQAQGFQRSSRDLRQQLWWNSMKGKLMVGGVAVFFIMIVMFVFFSGNGKSN